MPTTTVLDIEGQKVEELFLADNVFGIEPREHLFHLVLRMQLAARRTGAASTKTRSEVRASGKKPWKQKGTGRARAGSRSSPLWRGGGVIFGPKPRSYEFSVPRKVKKAAIRSALSLKQREQKLLVLNHIELPEIRTKSFISVMKRLNLHNPLIVIDGDNTPLQNSARNVPGVKVLKTSGLNLYDLLKYDHLVLTKDSIAYIERAYG